MDGLVAAAGFEIRDQGEVTGQHEDGEQGHLAERAELAGRRPAFREDALDAAGGDETEKGAKAW